MTGYGASREPLAPTTRVGNVTLVCIVKLRWDSSARLFAAEVLPSSLILRRLEMPHGPAVA